VLKPNQQISAGLPLRTQKVGESCYCNATR